MFGFAISEIITRFEDCCTKYIRKSKFTFKFIQVFNVNKTSEMVAKVVLVFGNFVAMGQLLVVVSNLNNDLDEFLGLELLEQVHLF